MDQKIKESEQHYARIVKHYIEENYVNTISMDRYLTGYSLYDLGNKIGNKISAQLLKEFLLGVQVGIKNESDKENFQLIRSMLITDIAEKYTGDIDRDYESVVTWYLENNALLRINYQRFRLGYDIFCLGRNIDCANFASILGENLQNIQVIVYNDEESLSVLKMRTIVREAEQNVNKR